MTPRMARSAFSPANTASAPVTEPSAIVMLNVAGAVSGKAEAMRSLSIMRCRLSAESLASSTRTARATASTAPDDRAEISPGPTCSIPLPWATARSPRGDKPWALADMESVAGPFARGWPASSVASRSSLAPSMRPSRLTAAPAASRCREPERRSLPPSTSPSRLSNTNLPSETDRATRALPAVRPAIRSAVCAASSSFPSIPESAEKSNGRSVHTDPEVSATSLACESVAGCPITAPSRLASATRLASPSASIRVRRSTRAIRALPDAVSPPRLRLASSSCHAEPS